MAKKQSTLIKKRVLDKIRKKMESEGKEITDEIWNEVIAKVEHEIEEDLKKNFNNHEFYSEV